MNYPGWGAAAVALAFAGLGEAAPAAENLEARPALTVTSFHRPGDPAELAPWRLLLEADLRTHLLKTRSLLPRDDKYALRRLGLRETDPITKAHAVEIGRIVEAHRVLYGTLERDGDDWVAETRLLNPASTEEVLLHARSDDWWNLRDQVIHQVLAALNVTPTEAEEKLIYNRWTESQEGIAAFAEYVLLGNQDAALDRGLEHTRKLIKLDPDSAVFWVAHAAHLFADSQIEEAGKAALRSLELNPSYDRAYLALIRVRSAQGAGAEAAELLEKLLEIDPESPNALRRRAEQLARRAGKPKEALALLKRARIFDPHSVTLATSLSAVYTTLGNRDAAERALNEAVTLAEGDPIQIDAERFIANAALRLGNYPLARTRLKRCLTEARAKKVGEGWVQETEDLLKDIEQRLSMEPVVATRPKRWSRAEIRELLREKLSVEERAFVENPLGITPEMRAWVQELAKGMEDEKAIAQKLFETMSGRIGTLSKVGSRTAEQVFANWERPDMRFSCQEYAKLFVVLGREVGLDTYMADIDRDYTGGWVYHSCAAVFLDDQCFLVDPTYLWFGVPHQVFRIADDLQTHALQLSQAFGEADSLSRMRAALKLDPTWGYALTTLARTQITKGMLREAELTLNKLAEVAPDRWDLPLLRSQLLVAKGELTEARRLADRFVEAYPDTATGHRALANVLSRQGEFAAAREHYRECLRLGVRPIERNAILRKLAQLNEQLGAGADSPLARAYRFVAEGDLEGAVAEYRKAIAENETSPELHRRLGTALMDLKRTEEGVTAWREYARLVRPPSSEAWEEVVAQLNRRDLYQEALAVAREGSALHPKNAELVMDESSALFSLGKIEESLAVAVRAIDLVPRDARYRKWHASLLAILGDWDEAERELERAAGLEDRRANPSPFHLTTLRILGRFDEAQNLFGSVPLAQREEDSNTKNFDTSAFLKMQAKLLAHLEGGATRESEEVTALLETLSRKLVYAVSRRAELEAEFAASKTLLANSGEEREITIISVQPGDESAAIVKTIREKLAAGGTPEEAAGPFAKEGTVRIGERGWTTWEDTAAVLRETIFAAKVGSLSATAEKKGYRMFAVVHARRGGKAPSLDDPDVRKEIGKMLLTKRRRAWEDRYWRRLQDLAKAKAK